MSQPNQMIGVSHVARARALTTLRDSKDRWPYFWLFPPASGDGVLVTGGIALPAITVGTYSLIIDDGTQDHASYRVPVGLAFIMTAVLVEARLSGDLNSAFAPGDGSIVFVLDVNQPLNAPLPMGAPVKGFNALTVPLGSFSFGPWPLQKPRIFDPLDQLRWKVTNVSIATGDVFVSAGIFGYTIPVKDLG